MRKPRDPAWLPASYTLADVSAVQALALGEAQPHQQKAALDWIIRCAAGTYEPSYRSDADGGDRETAYAEGRRFIGLSLIKLVNMPEAAKSALRKADGGS